MSNTVESNDKTKCIIIQMFLFGKKQYKNKHVK